MNPPAKDTIQRAAILLQDMTAVRWSTDELVEWLNDGQRAIQRPRPDATSTTMIVPLKGGARQDLLTLTRLAGDGGGPLEPKPAMLMKLVRNVAPGSNQQIIRLVARDALDAVLPTWMVAQPQVSVRNYTFDDQQPTIFHVYPPAIEPVLTPVPPAPVIPPAIVEMIYSAYPVDIAQPGPGKLWSDVDGDLSVEAVWAECLLDYIMYRAFTKDSEYAANGARAQAHFDKFQQPLVVEAQGTLLSKPKAKQATQ